jgi:hypothetical protein
MEADFGDDLMVGVKTIAAWMRLPVRQVFYMAEAKQLPIFKIGGRWAARKSTIAQHVAQLEATRAA